MYRWMCVLGLGVALSGACGTTVNVEQERTALLDRDRQWAETPKDIDKFMSYFAADASFYPQGAPMVTGTEAIRATFTAMSAMPGFSVTWKATKADVSSSGDVGVTTGTYQANTSAGSETGKFVTVWKKQGGNWMVAEDMFNADGLPTSKHAMVAPDTLKWGDAPPSLPRGAKVRRRLRRSLATWSVRDPRADARRVSNCAALASGSGERDRAGGDRGDRDGREMG